MIKNIFLGLAINTICKTLLAPSYYKQIELVSCRSNALYSESKIHICFFQNVIQVKQFLLQFFCHHPSNVQ